MLQISFSHLLSKRGILITMILSTIGLSLIHALLLIYWKKLFQSFFLPQHNVYNRFQSACRPGHSTEIALLKVDNDLFLSLNDDNILALLDFLLAFDTMNHSILVHSFHTDFGFTDAILQWFSSYLTDHTQYVSM